MYFRNYLFIFRNRVFEAKVERLVPPKGASIKAAFIIYIYVAQTLGDIKAPHHPSLITLNYT